MKTGEGARGARREERKRKKASKRKKTTSMRQRTMLSGEEEEEQERQLARPLRLASPPQREGSKRSGSSPWRGHKRRSQHTEDRELEKERERIKGSVGRLDEEDGEE